MVHPLRWLLLWIIFIQTWAAVFVISTQAPKLHVSHLLSKSSVLHSWWHGFFCSGNGHSHRAFKKKQEKNFSSKQFWPVGGVVDMLLSWPTFTRASARAHAGSSVTFSEESFTLFPPLLWASQSSNNLVAAHWSLFFSFFSSFWTSLSVPRAEIESLSLKLYRDWRPRQVCVGYFNVPRLRKEVCVCICIHWNKPKHSRAQTTNEFPLWELINRMTRAGFDQDNAGWKAAEVSPAASCSATVCMKSAAWWYDKDGTFRQHLHSLPLAFVAIRGSTLLLEETPCRHSRAPRPKCPRSDLPVFSCVLSLGYFCRHWVHVLGRLRLND